MAVSVHRLIQRGSARDTVHDRIALEDALGTTLPQDGRLVLVRKLTVRGPVASPQQCHDVVRRGWAEAVAGAVHATSSFAGLANCVWFAGRAEAEAILLAKLLAGEPVVGWFWALAVSDWRNLSLGDWLPRRILRCHEDRDHASLARIAGACIAAGRADAFVEAAARALRLTPTGAAAEAHFERAFPAAGRDKARAAGSSQALSFEVVRKLHPRLLTHAWAEMLRRIETADVSGVASRNLAVGIVREMVRRASPALALDQQLLSDVSATMLDIVAGRLSPVRDEPDLAPGARLSEAHDAESGMRRASASQPAPPLMRELPQPRASALPAARPAAAPQAAGPAATSLEREQELASRHAGLWLVVPSLIRLGFREWLGERRELLGDDPGRHLILAIALRQRVQRTDPALAILDTRVDDEVAPEWVEPWRLGLDRWLRRTARRRTHDLVARAGWIGLSEDRLDIRFLLDAADLRLRRLALDVDPGWTDWLGLSLRFHFSGPHRQ